jgi:nicotinamide phosphoribosyltransferase
MDGYKASHRQQYPSDTTLIYVNFTARGTKEPDVPGIIAFGMQYFVKEYLIRQWSEGFFKKPFYEVAKHYKRRLEYYLGQPVDVKHLEHLHNIGFLPLVVKAMPEGTLVPFRVPLLTLHNTDPQCFWLPGTLETLLSNVLWFSCTSATTAFLYRHTFEQFAADTCDNNEHVKRQGHDFSMRGLECPEASCLSGAAHLLSFTGTDTIPAIDLLEEYYGANAEKELVGMSVPATEHSVMSLGSAYYPGGEIEQIERLIDLHSTGILLIVADTFDFWRVMTEYFPKLKDKIMSRNGKIVIRPDSGDVIKIICGDHEAAPHGPEWDGAIGRLWQIFGGTVNNKGYKVLDPHIGLTYGDSITRDLQREILTALMNDGFASSNVTFGIGATTYQNATRDLYGFAMKATYAETQSQGPLVIWKDPKTDSGIKRSAKGLLKVLRNNTGEMVCKEECSWREEDEGLLEVIYYNGKSYGEQTLTEIRQRVEENL